jgi:hypothetical protein
MQVRDQTADHRFSTVAARAECRKHFGSLIDLGAGRHKFEGRHGDGQNGSLDSFERRGSSDRKNYQPPAPDLAFADGSIGKHRRSTPSCH